MMAVTIKWGGDQFKGAHRAAQSGALLVVAEDFQDHMVNLVSKAGRGRVYVINKTGQRTKKRVGLKTQRGRRGVEFTSRQEAARALRANRKSKSERVRGKRTRELGLHKASKPGDPPARRSGQYGESISIDPTGLKKKKPTVKVGTNLMYGRFLEFGTRHMARRPHFRKSLRTQGPRLVRKFKIEYQNQLAKFKGV